MIGKEKLFKQLEKVLDKSKADQTEIVYIGRESGLSRFANSYIHQNVYEDNSQLFFRTVLGKKVGVSSSNLLNLSDLNKCLNDSIEIAKTQPENPNFPGLPKPARYKELNTFDETTAKFSPNERAKAVKKIIAENNRKKFTVAGSLSTGIGEIAVLNSLGVRAYQPISSASVNMISMSDTSSGYATSISRKITDLDVVKLAKVAVEKCDRSQNPIQIEPGEYEVILEPAAVTEMLVWMNFVGFGSKPFQQNMSFLSGNIGKKITSDKITIYDNGLDEKSMSFPFDFEGVPKQKVIFIGNGVAKGVVYDSTAALKDKTKSTGHAVTPDENNEGAFGLNIFMAPGTAKRDQMISKVKKGILVTRFHYLNGFIDQRNSVLTGMTRDGTFLIENGEIKSGIKNLRFTDSFARCLGSTIAISKETERINSWWDAIGCTTVPTLHLGSFKFSGKTDF